MSALLRDVASGCDADCRGGVHAESHRFCRTKAILEEGCSLCDDGFGLVEACK